jgi:hypothetical protein
MAERVQETTETVARDDSGATRSEVVRSRDSASAGFKAEQIVYLIFGILEAILGLRVVLSLLGANQANSFAHMVYAVSYPLVAPFFGLFGYQFQAGVSRLEIETIVAMVVYAILGWIIVKLVNIGRS